MGYSPEYVENMTRIHQTLRARPWTPVQLVEGPDDLCAKFPEVGTYHCEDADVKTRDAAVAAQLGLEMGQAVTWEEIQRRIRQHVVPADIGRLCASCSWRAYGVCEDGVADINAGQGLRVVPHGLPEEEGNA